MTCRTHRHSTRHSSTAATPAFAAPMQTAFEALGHAAIILVAALEEEATNVLVLCTQRVNVLPQLVLHAFRGVQQMA